MMFDKKMEIKFIDIGKINISFVFILFALFFVISIKGVNATVGDYDFFTKINIIQNNSRAKAVVDDMEITIDKTYKNVSLNFGYDVNSFEVYSNYEYNYYNSELFRINTFLVALGVNYLFKINDFFMPYIGGEFGFNFSRLENYGNNSARFSGRNKVFKTKIGFEVLFFRNTYIDANVSWEMYSSRIRHINFILNQRYGFKYSLGLLYRFCK